MFQLSKSSVGRETLMSVLYNQRATGHFAAVTQREIHYSRLDTVPPFSTFTSLSINQNAMQPLHRAFWVMAPTHCTITITLWVQCMLLPMKNMCCNLSQTIQYQFLGSGTVRWMPDESYRYSVITSARVNSRHPSEPLTTFEIRQNKRTKKKTGCEHSVGTVFVFISSFMSVRLWRGLSLFESGWVG